MSEDYCSVYETMTRCRFYAQGQQVACKGFAHASWAKRCMWWHRLDDNSYLCGNPDSQAWAEEQYRQTRRG